MNRNPLVSTVGIALLASISVCPIARAQWRPEQRPQGQPAELHAQQQMQQAQQQAQQRQQQAQQQMQQRAQEQVQRQQQAQQQAQQQSQQRAQQDQQRQQQRAQEEQQKQQQRAQQEQQRQVQRAQQDQQRQQQAQQAQQRAREQTQRTQQSQQRNMQERAQRDQERLQRQQRDQQQAQQQQQQRDQQLQQQNLQQQQRAQQMQQQRDAKEQQHEQQVQQQRNAFEQKRDTKDQARWANGNPPAQMQQPGHGLSRIQNPIKTPNFDHKTRRPTRVPPLTAPPVPLQKAFPMPNFTSHASPDQINQARMAQENMLRHLRAVPMSQAPQNYARLRSRQLQSYYNNYPFWVNNRRYYVNRQNTSYYQVQPNYYPNWYQPNPNWVFSNGFSLANAVQVGIDWLGFGWQPYYGAPPTGFICARDYIPTPWLYDVATGQWRQPGLYSYMSEGPDYDYTGPITVEVIEQVFAPNGQIVNVPYLYNAFYYPDQGRWAYQNRQGYFIWLDV